MTTSSCVTNEWSKLLDALEADLRRREGVLQSLSDLNHLDEIDPALLACDAIIPEFIDAPDSATRLRAVNIREAIDAQGSRLEAALVSLKAELQRAVRQSEVKRARTVAQRNLGGFEARA